MKINKILKQEKINKKIKHIILKGYFYNSNYHDCFYSKKMKDMELFHFHEKILFPEKRDLSGRYSSVTIKIEDDIASGRKCWHSFVYHDNKIIFSFYRYEKEKNVNFIIHIDNHVLTERFISFIKDYIINGAKAHDIIFEENDLKK